ncbi:unnamed protein product [Cylicostephanus goldi]|uniref:Uncharacterized protein n=1 Tax=Cylicostephanus goldi TaxID=71465 RepID=A0A3P7N3N3_CYLGO|nr:unnamed protein product [Cylicostephanus goldi]
MMRTAAKNSRATRMRSRKLNSAYRCFELVKLTKKTT